MTRLGLILCFGAILAATPSQAQNMGVAPPLPATLTAVMEGKTVPAVGVLVIRNGQVVDQAVAGIDSLGSASPATVDDLWNLGSDSKAMTVTMIARLVERGVLSWEAPLSAMLPGLEAQMRPEYRDVTLVDLMSHRAGLPENHSDEAFFRTFFTDTRPLQEQRLAYLRKAVADAPVGPARGKPSYSNTGLILAGAIAERATGKSYETLMQEEVFGPLGMTTAVFNQTPGTGETSGHIDGRRSVAGDGNPQMVMPAGGIRMTLSDWARFCIDQMAGEAGRGKLLKPETYRLMHTPRGDSIVAMGWGVPPQISGRVGPVLTHGGSDGNWFAFVALFPGSENGVLAVANAAETMGGDAAVKAAARAVIQTLAPAVAPAS